jgi:hypothetical protein
MVSRSSNLMGGVGRYTFVVVAHGGTDSGGVWHSRHVASSTSSLRVLAR